jgi:serine/threonine protein kinase
MVPGTQPSPNFHSAAAYLEPGKALVFGGYYKTSYYGDTYTLSLKKGGSVGQWEKLNLTHSPKGLAYHAMAAIVGRRAVVLFGGHWSARSMSSDTWVFSASTMGWSQISGYSPSARGGHAMASLGENKAILFGGRFGPTYNNELWEFNYDTETWRKIEQGPNGSPFDWPPSRYGALLAPLYTPNTMIMYGGKDTDILTDTWILWFDGASNHHWERHASASLNSFEGTIAPIGTGPGTGPSVEVVVFGGEVTKTVNSETTYFFRSSCVRGAQLSENKKNCELCPLGTYSVDSSQKCTPCPPQISTLIPGSKDRFDCNICKKGKGSLGVCSLMVEDGDPTPQWPYKPQWNCYKGVWGRQCEHRCPGFDPELIGKPQPGVCGNGLNGICNDGADGDGMCHCSFFYSLSPKNHCKVPITGILFGAVLLLMLGGMCALVRYREKQKLILSVLSTRENQLLKASIELRREKIETQKAQEGWSIQEGEITLGDQVGSGSYGDVFKGKWAPLKDVPVAIKVVRFKPGEKATALDDAEMLLMQRIRHPRLVLFFGSGVLKSRNCSFAVTEFLAGGDLMEFIETAAASNDYEGAYPWEMRVRSALDIAEGMEYLHSRDWVHRDLKSANILRDEIGRCKITDFGLSKSLSGQGAKGPSSVSSKSAPRKRSVDTSIEMTAFTGSAPWLAPELITKNFEDIAVGGKEVDVYSFGCVLYELVEGRIPWSNAKCLEDIFGSVENGGRPKVATPMPSGHDQSYIHLKVCNLMSECWQQSASRRPSFSKIAKVLHSVYQDHCRTRKRASTRASQRTSALFARNKQSWDNGVKDKTAFLASDSLAKESSNTRGRKSISNPVVKMVARKNDIV